MKILTLVLALLAAPVYADHNSYEWDIDILNKHVDQTNFIVGRGCSGTLIDLEERLVLTNFHCIESFARTTKKRQIVDGKIEMVEVADNQDVPLSQKTYKNYELVSSKNYLSNIIAMDPTNDLALLQFKSDSIPYTIESKITTEPIIRGMTVYVVGNPAGLDASVHRGIVSSVNRIFNIGGMEHPYIQIDAGIVGGNSGGALYDGHGNFLGIPSAGSPRNEVLGLVTPAPLIVTFLEENCYGKVVDDTKPTYDECIAEREEDEEEE